MVSEQQNFKFNDVDRHNHKPNNLSIPYYEKNLTEGWRTPHTQLCAIFLYLANLGITHAQSITNILMGNGRWSLKLSQLPHISSSEGCTSCNARAELTGTVVFSCHSTCTQV